MKGCDIILDIIITSGVVDIFGYPGGCILDIYNSLRLRQQEIKLHTLNTEQSCVFAADGYSRASGRLGVVLATSGPGACNLVTGIASANMDSVPLLAITGNVPTYKLGSDSFQEVDILGVTMPITKYNHIVKSIKELPQKLIDAIHIATSKRHGATLIDIPEDIQSQDLDITHQDIVDMIAHRKTATPTIDGKQLLHVAQILNNSDKITVLVGGGATHCDQELISSFVNKLCAPVANTLMGVGNYPHDAINSLGLCGSFGNPTANHAIKSCDVVITLGARFGDRLISTGMFHHKQVIQIDIDDAEHDKNLDGVTFLHGDLQTALQQLLPLIDSKNDRFLTSLLLHRKKIGVGDNRRSLRNILHALAQYVGMDAPVATDVGNHQMFLAKHYCMGKTFLSSSGLGAMGYGLPAIIGANIAIAPQKSLLITGDGSINMSLVELATLKTLNLPCLVVIFNNGTLGMCYDMQLHRYGEEYQCCTPTKIDYVAMAKALGLDAYRANDVKSLKKILSSHVLTQPMVIELNVDI